MRTPLLLLLAWFLVNLCQAALTPLDADETYYWMYARVLDWGYYDHPPAVALLVSVGKDWLPGALGLRLGHVLAGTLTMAATWWLLDRPRGHWLAVAAALVFAQPFLNVYGFIATPDGPLLLFTVLYLLAYRRFLNAPGLANGALWGLTMTGLLYSKYHGVMLIFFSVLPNLLWLLRQPGAWVAALGGAALYVPHLWWQYAHDFPSFRYHLSGRDDPYRVSFTLGYLLNQAVIFSPLLLAAYWRSWRRPGGSPPPFLAACRWLVAGFLLFFLYTTTKGHTEAQWTALLSFPLVYLVYRRLRDRGTSEREVRRVVRLAWATVLILSLARVALMLPREWLPFEKPFDHAPWVERLAERADGLPVYVQNSYRLASLYEFYSGEPSWTFTDVEYRRNQYDLWVKDSVFHGTPVYLLGQKNWDWPSRPFRTQTRDMRTARVADFQVAKSVRLSLRQPLPDTVSSNVRYPITLVAELPVASGIDTLWFNRSLGLQPFLIAHQPEQMLYWELEGLAVDHLVAGRPTVLLTDNNKMSSRLLPGPVSFELGLAYGGMPPLRGMSGYVEGWVRE